MRQVSLVEKMLQQLKANMLLCSTTQLERLIMRNTQQALTTTIFGNLHEPSLGMRLWTTSLLLQTVNGE